jgi:hypothetical protein
VWWNEDYRRAVAQSRKARNACDPKRGGINCETNRAIWRKKESEKKKTILKAKQTALNKHINSLNPKSSPTKTWAFKRAWTGSPPTPDLYSSPLRDPETGQLTTDLDEKARILAQKYDHTDKNSQDNPTNEQHIARMMDTPELNGLNSPITERELRDGMSNLKSNAMGQDMVHNMMLKNLSNENKSPLLHLLNSMLQTANVPDDWKKASSPSSSSS